MTLGERVKTLRLRNGMSQMELASMTGITQPYISQIERGSFGQKNIRLNTLKRLAGALGITLDDLVGATSSGKTDPSVSLLIKRYKALPPKSKRILMNFANLLRKQER